MKSIGRHDVKHTGKSSSAQRPGQMRGLTPKGADATSKRMPNTTPHPTFKARPAASRAQMFAGANARVGMAPGLLPTRVKVFPKSSG